MRGPDHTHGTLYAVYVYLHINQTASYFSNIRLYFSTFSVVFWLILNFLLVSRLQKYTQSSVVYNVLWMALLLFPLSLQSSNSSSSSPWKGWTLSTDRNDIFTHSQGLSILNKMQHPPPPHFLFPILFLFVEIFLKALSLSFGEGKTVKEQLKSNLKAL